MNYYPFHIGDYASATRHLSWEEDCAFRRLLDVYYTTERAIPLELRAACRLVMATTEQQRSAVEVVLHEFFEKTPDGWINRRADMEIAAMQEKQQKQRDKARKRWDAVASKPDAAALPESERGNASENTKNGRSRAVAPNDDKAAAAAMPRDELADAAASGIDADAMPPTPTPTPTPKINTRADALTVASLMQDGLTEQTASEFLALRKAKRAKLTPMAWNGIKTEAEKVGWSPEQAVCKALARGWTGFEAHWVRSDTRQGNGVAL